MISLSILGSSSKGNCALVESDGCRILIDCGLSAQAAVARLAILGVQPDSISGIVLTHEHGDHTSGLANWCKKYHTPVYCVRDVAGYLQERGTVADWRLFNAGKAFAVSGLTIDTFQVPHDAIDPVGFALFSGNNCLGFLNDLGESTPELIERLQSARGLFIEANHSESLIMGESARPWEVRQRVLSRLGHLSNRQAFQALQRLPALKRAVFGHLSSEFNSPAVVLNECRAFFSKEFLVSVGISVFGISDPVHRITI